MVKIKPKESQKKCEFCGKKADLIYEEAFCSRECQQKWCLVYEFGPLGLIGFRPNQ